MLTPGQTITFEHTVSVNDVAAFQGSVVHHVYSTFALARDMEWTSRQFVIAHKAGDEEGIGTFLTIDHRHPAFTGDRVVFTATIISWEGNTLMCDIEVRSGDTIVATGKTGQKILKKEKIERIFKR